MHAVPARHPEDVRSLRSGVTDSCEPSRGCWAPNSLPLLEYGVLLTSEVAF